MHKITMDFIQYLLIGRVCMVILKVSVENITLVDGAWTQFIYEQFKLIVITVHVRYMYEFVDNISEIVIVVEIVNGLVWFTISSYYLHKSSCVDTVQNIITGT
eukprot:535124_1